MARNMLNRALKHPETLHGDNFKPAQNMEVKKTGARHMHAAPTPHKQARTVVRYKQPSKLVLHKQRQVDILIEWNVCLQQKLLELRKKEAQSYYLAYRDELTGLPNRHLLEDRLNQALPQSQRRHKPLAVLLLNIDDFTRVNDTLGRVNGDKLLQEVAQRLSAGIRGADTASRYGGDEFVIVLQEIESPHIVPALAAEVHERLGQPYIIDGHEIRLTVSIGAAIYPDDGQTYEELMKQADHAMYNAKNTGRGVSILALPQSERVNP
ncbi:MAG: GGDEF domain-containing protein [Gammaproteobacteria bacterium]|nr:GGDEF domain-containing protein [Gammaproteobacteria bacterium]